MLALQGTALPSREEVLSYSPTEALIQSMILGFPCWFLLVIIFSFSFFGYVGIPLSPGKQIFVTGYH